MDFTKLKELAKHLGGVLVMNGNEPEFVILPYDKYTPREPAVSQLDEQLVDQLNNEILALKEEIRQKELPEVQEI